MTAEAIRKNTLKHGVWLVVNLDTYEMIHYPASFCCVDSRDPDTIKIIDNMGTQVRIIEIKDFGVLWNFDKDRLIRYCEHVNFQVGIHPEARKKKVGQKKSKNFHKKA